jgi:SAM-dependent methyltransferase
VIAGYWNGIPAVSAEINRRISGRPDVSQFLFFHEQVRGRRFARALFLACGNGWVERYFCDTGIVATADCIDISEELLADARAAAGGRPLAYHLMDVNQAAFPRERYDLIVNFSAAHRVAFVDRVFRAFSAALTEDGYLFCYDYVGPHRNQYPWEQWEACWQVNGTLPPEAQQDLRYPHFATMVHVDPTEAVHSELLLETYGRYFTTETFRPVGGALAYPLLNFNEALEQVPVEEQKTVVQRVMLADERYMNAHPASTLFAYWYGRPKRGVLNDAALLRRWEAEENAREASAAANGHRYYDKPLLEALMYAREGTGADTSA